MCLLFTPIVNSFPFQIAVTFGICSQALGTVIEEAQEITEAAQEADEISFLEESLEDQSLFETWGFETSGNPICFENSL